MTVIFSVNGQVHGHYTTEFVSRTLKFHLLKDYLLIHVDCTDLDMEFRRELFMASRDRLKDGKESRDLRKRLGDLLKTGRLREVYKARKARMSVDDTEAEDLIRNLTANLPLRNELMRLFGHTLKLKKPGKGPPKAKRRKKRASKGDSPAFHPQRYPSFLKAELRNRVNGTPMVHVPLGGKRTIRFSTDVEDQYFDRVADPGELSIALVHPGTSGRDGPMPPLPNDVNDVFNIVKSSPKTGTIRLGLEPTKDVQVGDAVTISASLSGPGGPFQERVLIKIVDREQAKKLDPKGTDNPDQQLGLPRLVRVYKDTGRGDQTWETLEDSGVEMDHGVIVHPVIDDTNMLTDIYVNMDSNVLLRHRRSLRTQEAIEVADQRYTSTVYFHTLFLYTITQSRKYRMRRDGDAGQQEDVSVAEYLHDLFRHHYAEFLLSFEMDQLMAALE